MSKLEGDWNKVVRNLDKLGTKVVEAGQLGLQQSAMTIEAAVVKHIVNQDLGWKALDPAYKKYKEKKGLSNQILIATSTLVNSVTTKQSADKMEAFVGVLRQGKKRKDGTAPVVIAAVHEFGSPKRGIPARPYLRPTFKEQLPKVQELVKKSLKKALDETGR